MRLIRFEMDDNTSLTIVLSVFMVTAAVFFGWLVWIVG